MSTCNVQFVYGFDIKVSIVVEMLGFDAIRDFRMVLSIKNNLVAMNTYMVIS